MPVRAVSEFATAARSLYIDEPEVNVDHTSWRGNPPAGWAGAHAAASPPSAAMKKPRRLIVVGLGGMAVTSTVVQGRKRGRGEALGA